MFKRRYIKEVQSAIEWVAAEYNELEKLHNTLTRIGQEFKGTERDLRKARRVARWVGRAEGRSEKKISDILKVLANISDTKLQKVIEQVKIPENLLVKESSLYVGSLRKGIAKINTNVSLEKRYPNDQLRQSIQRELRTLDVKVQELEKWVAALEVGLKKIKDWIEKNAPKASRRQFLKGAVATAITAGISKKAFASDFAAAQDEVRRLKRDNNLFDYETNYEIVEDENHGIKSFKCYSLSPKRNHDPLKEALRHLKNAKKFGEPINKKLEEKLKQIQSVREYISQIEFRLCEGINDTWRGRKNPKKLNEKYRRVVRGTSGWGIDVYNGILKKEMPLVLSYNDILSDKARANLELRYKNLLPLLTKWHKEFKKL